MAKKKRKKKSGKMVLNTFLVMSMAMGIVFLPTTFMLAIGMLPTLVAALVDRAKRKSKAITVGAMNLAGTVPFVLDLWRGGNNFEASFEIIADPQAIIVIYSAAGIGYLIDWAMTGMVAGVLVQRGHARKKVIVKRQEELVARWGEEVTGELTLDQHGFRVDGDTSSE